MNHHIKVHIFQHCQTKTQNFPKLFYTIHKINEIIRKVMAVQKVMRCIFNFQTTKTQRIEAEDSLRWLKPKRKRVKNFNPIGSNILYTLLSRGRMNDNSLRLKYWNWLRVSYSFIYLYQSFRVEGKKEFLKQSVRRWTVGIRFILVLVVCWIFGIKLIK